MPPTKKAKKAARASPKKAAGGARKTTKKKAARSPRKSATSPSGDAAATCAGVTTKGTPCRLKASAGSPFCARHADQPVPDAASAAEAAPTPAAAAAAAAAHTLAEATAEAAAPPARASRSSARAPADEAVAAADDDDVDVDDDVDAEGADDETSLSEESSLDDGSSFEDDVEEADDEAPVLYGSVYSTTLEASPYDDMSPEMAEGAEDVELVDEHQMGRGGAAPRPQMSREEAEKRAAERLGPRPDIEPEEDLDGLLGAYDRRFEAEVRFQMGLRGGRKRRRRGRRGGRGRRQGDGGAWQGGGGGGGGGRRGGGRRRGRGRRQGGGGGGGGGPRGPSPGAGKVARDSPLANRRSSRGPKGGLKPRRRRQPDF